MKSIVISCLLILFTYPPLFGATDCRIVEYPDRIELICVGDEKYRPESIDQKAPVQPLPPETVERKREIRSQSSEPAPAAEKYLQPPPLSASPAASPPVQAGTPTTKSDRYAEELAKRRELATRNTRNLKSNPATAPGL